MFWRVESVLMRNQLLGLTLLCISLCPLAALAEDKSDVTKYQVEIPGWYAETRKGDFQIGLDTKEKHGGTKSAYLESVVPKPRDFGNVTNWFDAKEYCGKRIKMSAWVKTKLTSGTAQLWLRIDGDWDSVKAGSFDNMGDRPIRGTTDWTQHDLVVDVPETSTDIVFGFMLIGTGRAWLDDVSFETVSKNVPLTGYGTSKKQNPRNLNFEDTQ